MASFPTQAKFRLPWPAIGLFIAVSLVADWFVLDGMWEQHRASRFPTAAALITHSEVVVHRGGRGGPTYTLDLSYDFSVDGRKYSASRLRSYGTGVLARDEAKRLHHQFPVGQSVPAFYNPDDPKDAILMPGVSGKDWMNLLLAVILNMFTVGMVGSAAAKRTTFDPQDPACVAETGAGWEAHLPYTSHAAVLGFTMSVLCVAAAMVLPILRGPNPPPEMVGAAMAAAAAIAAIASATFARYPTLSADLDAKELVLPASLFGASLRAPFDDVLSVVVREREKSAWSKRKYPVYACDVNVRVGEQYRNTIIATYPDRSEAERLALWIKLTLGQEVPEANALCPA